MNSRQKATNGLIIALALLAGSATLHAETIYDHPYMADIGWNPPTNGLARIADQSTLIFIGVSETLEPTYTGRIRPLESLKGTLPGQPLVLSWQPSATGISIGSKHLFFVLNDKGTNHVLKEMYIHAGAYDAMRTYGALDGGRDATLMVLRSLTGLPVDHAELSALLVREAQRDEVQRRQTVSFLAADLASPDSVPALTYILEHQGEELPLVAYTLMRLSPDAGTRTVLRALVTEPRMSPWLAANFFCAIAKAHSSSSPALLEEFGNSHPEYQVSCAYTLAELCGTNAIPVIQKWRTVAESSTKEKVSTGWTLNYIPRERMLKDATSFAAKIENQQSVAGYPPQGVGSPEP